MDIKNKVKIKEYLNVKKQRKFLIKNILKEKICHKEEKIYHKKILLIFIFFIYFPIITSEIIRKLDSTYEITLIIETNEDDSVRIIGNQAFPDQVIINGKEEDPLITIY